jgi:hypothetical protein
MAFILQKAFLAHIRRMRGHLLSFGSGLVFGVAIMLPQAASARDTEQSDAANCTDPKHRHTVVRPLTESTPIRKSEKVRVRRILM